MPGSQFQIVYYSGVARFVGGRPRAGPRDLRRTVTAGDHQGRPYGARSDLFQGCTVLSVI